MSLRSRLPMVLLTLAALVLGALIVLRVSAGADTTPQDTRPIVIHTSSSQPTAAPTKKPTAKPTNTVTQVAPPPRPIDDNGHHQRGKGKGGPSGTDDGGSGGDN